MCDASYVLLTYLQHYRTDVKVKMRVRMRDSKAVNLSAVWQAVNVSAVWQCVTMHYVFYISL